MLVIVTKDKHTHDCTTPEQLERFLAAGWKKARKQNVPEVTPGNEQNDSGQSDSENNESTEE